MPGELLVARNPDPDSTLPFLVRLPLGPDGLVLKTRESWPHTSKVYCHRTEGWPQDAEVLERVPVRTCTRRGPAIDLVLDRARENRSQLVVTRARGREVIFWQSPRTAKQARPNVTLPTRRAAGQVLDIVVDSGEKYPYTFRNQQATTSRRRLPAGDYAVELDGAVVAVVERKSLPDLAGSLLAGRLTYALAELGLHAAATGAAVDLLVPQAPLPRHRLEPAPPPAGSPTAEAAAVRLWALTTGRPVAARGRLSVELIHAYRRDHPDEPA